MKRFSSAVALVAAAAVVLTLSSCAPAVHPTTAPTTHPHATTKPQQTQAAIPPVRVPVKCGSLFPDSVVAGLIDAPVEKHSDENTNPVDITDVTARQYGTLRCLWGAEPQDSGFVYELSVDITPDASAGFAANLASFADQNPPVVSNTAGDKSVYGCAGGGLLSCTGNMLVAGYWVTVNLGDIGTSTTPSSTANSRIQQVLATVAAALKGTKAGTAWVAPGGALPGFCSATSSTAAINAAVGESDLTVVGEDSSGSDAASYPQLPAVYAQCGWQANSSSDAFTGVGVAMLKGGAWVLPQLAGESSPTDYMLTANQPMTVPGADKAAGDCSVDADQCVVNLSIGSLLVVVYMDDPNDAQATAALAKIVAAIKAS